MPLLPVRFLPSVDSSDRTSAAARSLVVPREATPIPSPRCVAIAAAPGPALSFHSLRVLSEPWRSPAAPPRAVRCPPRHATLACAAIPIAIGPRQAIAMHSLAGSPIRDTPCPYAPNRARPLLPFRCESHPGEPCTASALQCCDATANLSLPSESAFCPAAPIHCCPSSALQHARCPYAPSLYCQSLPSASDPVQSPSRRATCCQSATAAPVRASPLGYTAVPALRLLCCPARPDLTSPLLPVPDMAFRFKPRRA